MKSFPAMALSVLVACACLADAAVAQPDCGQGSQGDYVVIEVRWEDPIQGLAVRDQPNKSSALRGVVPAAGTGIGIDECTESGWCRVRYQCISGWSYLARFLTRSYRRLYQVSGVLPNDPEGLNLRTGPHSSFAATTHIPYNATGVIVHVCQPSPKDRSEWCLVTYNNQSGWALSRFLTLQIAVAPPPPSSQPSSPPSRACKMYPSLC